MQAFILAIMCCVMLNDYLVKILGLPGILRFLPEAMSAVVILYVVIAGTRNRFRLVAPKYWLTFAAFAVVLLCGVINGAPGVGPVLSGSRFYLRAVPMFFLPAVFVPTENQLKQQFRWFLALALVQVPTSVYQRWVIQSEHRFSGDDVVGTVMDSGILSILLIGAVAVLTGFLLRRRIGAWQYAALSFVLLIPTSINETKVTVFFLPLVVLVTIWVGAAPGKRARNLAVALMGIVALGALFVPVYNLTQVYNPFKNEKDIVGFFTDEKKLGKYLSSDVGGIGTKKRPAGRRRRRSHRVPGARSGAADVRPRPRLGIAVHPGEQLRGLVLSALPEILDPVIHILSSRVWRSRHGADRGAVLDGLFGHTGRGPPRPGLIGAFAVGWTAIVAMFVLCVVYTVFHEFTSVTYLYWYFSGLICARRVALEAEARRAHAAGHADRSRRNTTRLENA